MGDTEKDIGIELTSDGDHPTSLRVSESKTHPGAQAVSVLLVAEMIFLRTASISLYI